MRCVWLSEQVNTEGSSEITPNPRPPAPLPWWRLTLGVLAGVAVFLVASTIRDDFSWINRIGAVVVTALSIAFVDWRRRH